MHFEGRKAQRGNVKHSEVTMSKKKPKILFITTPYSTINRFYNLYAFLEKSADLNVERVLIENESKIQGAEADLAAIIDDLATKPIPEDKRPYWRKFEKKNRR